MSEVDVVVGKKYEFQWPRERPAMRLVGKVVGIGVVHGMKQAVVEWDREKPYHTIVLPCARVREVAHDAAGTFQIKLRTNRR